MRTGVAMALFGLTAACTTPAAVNMAQQRLAKEANCPARDVTVTELAGYGYRASGCGHAATYICIPQGEEAPICTLQGATSSGPTAADAGAT